MKKLVVLVSAALLLLVLAACQSGDSAPSGTDSAGYQTISPEESTAPTEPAGLLSRFSATDLEGGDIDQSLLADYSLTMVNVWATYCGPCLQEMPDLGELAAEYQSRGVQIVGLITDVLNADGSVSDSQLETAREIVAATGADYPHIVPGQDLFGLLYQITSVPTTFFVDAEGNQVGTAYVGSRSKDDWAAIMDEVLAEVTP